MFFMYTIVHYNKSLFNYVPKPCLSKKDLQLMEKQTISKIKSGEKKFSIYFLKYALIN